MFVRAVTRADRSARLRRRRELWPDLPAVEHALEWGRRLVESAEQWAANQGLETPGSDAPCIF